MMLRMALLLLSFLCLDMAATAQGDTPGSHWLDPAETFDKGRFWKLSGAIAVGYTGVVVGLDRIWYSQYPRGRFRTFNDMGEWEDMDKFGHLYTAYMEAKLSTQAYRWTGMEDRKAIWIGFGLSTLFQTTLETMDGFSEQWGWSWGDVVYNTSGSLLYLGQELAWREQRITLKYSSWRRPVDDLTLTSADGQQQTTLRQRRNDLYGTNVFEVMLKDYNASTMWASANIHAFLGDTGGRFPQWLNIAVGYGAENVYGGYENRWTDEETGAEFSIPETADLQRKRQFFLALDIDLNRIPTRNKFLKTLFSVFNVIKVPAPTLELDSRGGLRFHPIYF